MAVETITFLSRSAASGIVEIKYASVLPVPVPASTIQTGFFEVRLPSSSSVILPIVLAMAAIILRCPIRGLRDFSFRILLYAV